MKILVDTSFLLLMAELGRDLISMAERQLNDKLEPYIIEDILKELENLCKKHSKKAFHARTALEIANRMGKLEAFGKGSVDRKLIETAKEYSMPIATNDFKLIREAKKEHVKILFMHRDLRITLEE
ncbi:MAG: hypothetical protein QXK95_00465 [Nitrososphaerota archaeon]